MNYTITDNFDKEILNQRMMGPNSMRITEEMTAYLPDYSGKRILDLGCGRALSSIVLAEKYAGALIVSADLWISPTDNYKFLETQGYSNRIIPLLIDATKPLPFAEDYFDLLVSVDSYHYFGDKAGAIQNLLPHMKNGAKAAIAVPGLKYDFTDGIPADLRPYWQDDMNFHSCGWWKALLDAEPGITVEACREAECYRKAWDDWLACDNPYAVNDRDMMKAEGGKYYNIVHISADIAK